jgi:tetratricopeptide (TPR) repeat protein
MRCDDVRTKLDDYFDHTLEEREASAVEEHLYSCASCRDEYETREALRDLLRTSSHTVSPPGSYFQELFARAMQRHKAEARSGLNVGGFVRRVRRWVTGPGLGFRFARAAVLILVGLVAGMYLVAHAPASFQWLIPVVRSSEKPEPSSLEIATQPVEEGTAEHASGTRIVKSAFERERGAPVLAPAEVASAVVGEPELPEKALASAAPEGATESRISESAVSVHLKPGAPQAQPNKLMLVANKIRESAVLEDLANIRMNLYLSGEERYIPEFQKIEGLFYEIIQTDTAEDQDYIETHKLYQTAERYLLDRQYFDALKCYYLVAHRRPNSLLAFLSRFQIANINFEVLHDYEGALLNYEKCLEHYPAHFISDEKKDMILSRMELLTKNAQDNWRPLRFYYRARTSKPEVAKLLYQEILESYPSSTLVKSSIEALTGFAIGEQYEGAVTPEEILTLLQNYCDRWPETPSRAYVQLGIADILNYRLHNYQQALLEYLHVANTASDPKATQIAKERIHRLYQRGITGKE